MQGATLPLALDERQSEEYEVRWFSGIGCVVDRGDVCEVFVGGTLIGSYDPKDRDRGPRNVLMVSIAREPRIHLGQLAAAFVITQDYLRELRRAAEQEGMGALMKQARGASGRPRRLSARGRAQLAKLFEEGLNVMQAHRRIRGRYRVSESTVRRERKAWEARRAQAAEASQGAETKQAPTEDSPTQSVLPFEAGGSQPAAGETTQPVAEPGDSEADDSDASDASDDSDDSDDSDVGDAGDDSGAVDALHASEVREGDGVQHAGTWLMIAMVAQLGLYGTVASLWGTRKGSATLRIVVDAVVAALAIGERCVEGVRRLATPSAPILLRASHAPTASWSRRVLGRFVKTVGSLHIHFALAGTLLRAARTSSKTAAVFYIDNHMRPYTGKHTVRKGWRMQDKRVRPGATDYWVHDESGRPVFRVDVPGHDSLSKWLLPIAEVLAKTAGDNERTLLAFDRAGAFPETMATLRDTGIEFVTYERRPYPLLAGTAFEHTVLVGEDEVGVHESALKNLRGGRGRVRRIALRMPDGQQVNLLASSLEPAERLIEIMVGAPVTGGGRWRQENAFKHGVERWGMNQLDSRRTEHYDPDTVVPNPARRRLDRALRIAHEREGDARNRIARFDADHPRRQHAERDLAEALAEQRELDTLRPTMPTHAPLRDTELADKLVKHDSHYKTLLDTIRVACINAEADLAGELAPHLRRAAEAKKALVNLLAAPGNISITKSTIRVELQPAGTPTEWDAFEKMLAAVNRRDLRLPGDARGRRLRFALQPRLSAAAAV